MAIEILTAADSQRWNAIVDSSINGTLYHSWEWLKIVEKHSGCKLFPLVFFDTADNKPFGAFPLFYMRKLGIKMIFSPPPGNSITLGPVLLSKGYKQHKFELAYLDFQAAIDEFIRKLGANFTYFISSPGLQDIRPFIWAHYDVRPLYTYKIDLSQGEEAVWKSLSDNPRKNINKAKKNAIRVVAGDKIEDVEEVYNSLKKRYADQQLNMFLKKDYLQDLFRQFKGSSLCVYLAYNGEKVICSTLYARHKDTVTALIGDARNEADDLGSLALIRWEAILQAMKDGYRYFELAGANTRNICNAKAMYCPTPVIYFEAKKADLWGSLAEKAYLAMQKKRW